MSTSQQQRFDSGYISSPEICKRLGVTRSAILAARKRGELPDPIVVNAAQVFLWERPAVQHIVEAWLARLTQKRTART